MCVGCLARSLSIDRGKIPAYLIPTMVNPSWGARSSLFHRSLSKWVLSSVRVNSPYASTMSDGGPLATVTQWSPRGCRQKAQSPTSLPSTRTVAKCV